MAATLGVPVEPMPMPVASSSSNTSSSNIHLPLHKHALRNAHSEGTFRTPNSSENDLSSADGSHSFSHHLHNTTGESSTSFSFSQGPHYQHINHQSQYGFSLSPPPDLSFSKSSLHSDQEIEFLSRNGDESTSGIALNRSYHSQHVGKVEHACPSSALGDNVRIASSSQGHDEAAPASSSYPYHQNDSWGSRHSGKYPLTGNITSNSNPKSRIRLDSVFGTQLPGFPYLNSAAAATSSALGHPINPHYSHHHGSTSSADLLRGKASYNWTERSGSAASHYAQHNARAPTSNSMRSTLNTGGKVSRMASTSGSASQTSRPATASGIRSGEIETSCSGETGESNSSDEVDLDLSFDMDVLRARQMQHFHARQQREVHQEHAHHSQSHPQSHTVDITSSQVQAQRQARARALSSSEYLAGSSTEGHSRSGHVGIDMNRLESSNDSLALPSGHDEPEEQHRRYRLGGKKRLSRSAVELRSGGGRLLHASNAIIDVGESGMASRNPKSSTTRTSTNYSYRHSGPLTSSMPVQSEGNTASQYHRTSRASLDLAVSGPLPIDAHGSNIRPPFMDEDESSAHLGWSFATTPPLSPAEIVTFAESMRHSRGHEHHHQQARRYSAGASNLFHSLDRKKSSNDMLSRKRRPSFPLMSLLDKAIIAPVTGMVASGNVSGMNRSGDDNTPRPQSPGNESEPSWGSPTPRESVLLDPTTTMTTHAQPSQQHEHRVHVPLVPIPSEEPRNLRPQASISELARTPESANDEPLPAPPRLHDPAARSISSPVSSSLGSPGTLSPDLCNTNSTFSSPRSPSEDLPTPRTADFGHSADGSRYSAFTVSAVSDGRTSCYSTGSETLEAVNTKRDSKIFGVGTQPVVMNAALDIIPEQSDSLNASLNSTSAQDESPKKSRPQSASALDQSSSVSIGGVGISGQRSSQQFTQQQQKTDIQAQQGHKRQSSSLFRFPFVSSLRNPFVSRPATPSIITTSPHDHLGTSQTSSTGSQDSPTAASEELLSAEAIAAGIARKDAAGKRSNSPNSSEESHFLTPSDPPSPPRPGATSQASKGIDPSMLRDGPNTGKGRLSGLGLSFPSTFANSQPRSVSESQPTIMQQRQIQHHNHSHRQSSLPVLSFSAASDEQHEAAGRSVESEEAAIQVVPDENGFGRPIDIRHSSDATQRFGLSSERRHTPASAPATTVHFIQQPAGIDQQMEQLNVREFGAAPYHARSHVDTQSQQQHSRRPRRKDLSLQGLDLRERIHRMRPSQLLFLAAFIAGPWCFVLGGWYLRSIDGDFHSVKGVRCRCSTQSDSCECQAEIYTQIKLSGGQVERVLQSQNGEVRRMDRFVLANRVAALFCGTGTLVLSITALIVLGRAW